MATEFNVQCPAMEQRFRKGNANEKAVNLKECENDSNVTVGTNQSNWCFSSQEISNTCMPENFKVNKVYFLEKDTKIYPKGMSRIVKHDSQGVHQSQDQTPSAADFEPSNVNQNNQQFTRQKITFTFPSSGFKRKLHRSYTSTWNNDISKKGYAHCIITTCNFISLDILNMQEHYRICDGVPNHEKNCCQLCHCWLSSLTDLETHVAKCEGLITWKSKKPAVSTYEKKNRLNNEVSDIIRLSELQAEDFPESSSSQGSSMTTTESISVCHSKSNAALPGNVILDNEEKKTPNTLHFKEISKLMNSGVNSSKCIIQPSPTPPKGQYRRRRGFTKQHKTAWISKLEKDKYVKCMFQNCYFLAMSLEDMISHFGYCNGDGSFASYICPFCQGRVTSAEILEIHVQKSHSSVPPKEDFKINPPVRAPDESDLLNENFLFIGLNNNDNLYTANRIENETVHENHIEINFNVNDNVSNNDACTVSDSYLGIGVSPDNNITNEYEQPCVTESEESSLPPKEDFKINLPVGASDESYLLNESLLFSADNNNGNLYVDEPLRNKTIRGNSIEMNINVVDNINDNNNDTCTVSDDVLLVSTVSDPVSANDNSGNDGKENDDSSPINMNNNSNSNNDEGRTVGGCEIIAESGVAENADVNMLNSIGEEECHPDSAKCVVGSTEPTDLSEATMEETITASYEIPQVNVIVTPCADNSSNAACDVDESDDDIPLKNIVNCKSRKKRKATSPPSTPELPPKKPRNKKIIVDADCVKCAKCDFGGNKTSFNDHNIRRHAGLSWIDGETPLDIENEPEVLNILKKAFKIIKSAKCDNCLEVKKSAAGFLSHLRKCGKSAEEKEALKVQCPHCSKKVLPYSLPVHIKLSHYAIEEKNDLENKSDDEEILPDVFPNKRRSAVKALNKFQKVLNEEDGDGKEDDAKNYIFYEKGITSKMPKIPKDILSSWRKSEIGNENIPCRRGGCQHRSETVNEAKKHHFMCSVLPNPVYLCQLCHLFYDNVKDIKRHVENHSSKDKDYEHSFEAEEIEEEENWREEMNFDDYCDFGYSDSDDDGRNRLRDAKRKSLLSGHSDSSADLPHKREFLKREHLDNNQKQNIYYQCLNKVFKAKENVLTFEESWPQLSTTIADWKSIPLSSVSRYIPALEESLPVHISTKELDSVIEWKKLKRLEGHLFEGVPTLFTGGAVRSLAWSPLSTERLKQKCRQYLAVSTGKNVGQLPNVCEHTGASPGIIQIWDCGVLGNSEATSEPRFVLGIAHESGEIWDMGWIPKDTFLERSSENLERLGLLATASQDGIARIWSVCDPSQLSSQSTLPMYFIHPTVILKLEDNCVLGCLKISVSPNGTVFGGYSNGVIAAWSLKSLSSVFSKSDGKSKILKPFLTIQAHRSAITALSVCSVNDRYISTASLDRSVRFWDLESPFNPIDSYYKELCLETIWPSIWPVNIIGFDDVTQNSAKGFIRGIRDGIMERHHSLSIEHFCGSLSYSDWLNALIGCNNFGEVKIKYLRSLFVGPEKTMGKSEAYLATAQLRLIRDIPRPVVEMPAKGKGKKGKGKTKKEDFPKSYNEAQTYCGLIICDHTKDFKNTKKDIIDRKHVDLEEFPILAVNKVCVNPNPTSCTHIAVGYNSGIVRIQSIKELQKEPILRRFVRKLETANS